MPSQYTLDAPPPVEPPAGVMELTAWSIAVQLWRDHQPDSLLRAECLQCRTAWPCATWQVADGIIADLGRTTHPGHQGGPKGTPRHAEPARRGPRPPRLVGAEGSTQELPRVADRPFVGAYRRE